MALKTRGIITQVAKETTFNTLATFTSDDVVKTITASLNPKVDMVDRKCLSCSVVKEAGIPVRYTADGSVEVEIEVQDTSTDLIGSILYEAGFGKKELPATDTGCLIGLEGDGSTSANKISKPDSGVDGTATLYEVTDGDVERLSLSVRKFFDSGDAVIDTTGVVISQVSLKFSQADILTASFSLEGAGFAQKDGLVKPACATTAVLPFVGKNGTFTFYGTSVDVSDLQIDIKNTITNVEALTSEGFSDKLIVEKELTGSFKCLLTDFSYLTKLKNQTVGELFTKVDADTHTVGVYAPRLKISDVQVTDDSGKLIEVSINFTIEKDTTSGNILFLGSK